MQKFFKRSLALVLSLMMIITMFGGAFSVSADVNAGRIPWHDFVTHGENHALTNMVDAYWVTADQAPSGQKSIGAAYNAGANGAAVFHMAPNAAVDASAAKYVAFDVYSGRDVPAAAIVDAGVNIGDGASWDNWGKVTDAFASTLRANGGLKAGWNLFILPVYEWDTNAHANAVQNGRVYFVFNSADYNGTKLSVNDLVFYTEEGYTTAVERNKAKAATLAIWDIPAVNDLTLDDKATVEAAAAAYEAVQKDCKALVKGADTLAAAQAKIAELEAAPAPVPTIDGEKDDLYTDAKSMTVTSAYAGVGQAATKNTTQGTIKTYYTWDDDYNYVYMEISEPGYAYTGQNADYVYYVNNSNVAGYLHQNAGGGYIGWTLATGVDGATSAGSTLMPAEKAGYIDGATGQTRRYEFKFDRDPASDGFFISPVIYGSASYVVGYHSFYNTNAYYVKYEDESTWTYTDVPEKVIYDESLYNLDVVKGLSGTRYNITSVDNKNYTEGTGSHYIALGDNNVANFEIMPYGTNENGSNAVTNTRDISKFINEDGEFYVTFDMYVSDPAIVTNQRFMFGMGCYIEGKYQDISGNCLALNANTQSGRGNATWADFGLTDGVKAGWNKLAIKMDCSADSKYLEGADATRWDATKFRFIRFMADGFTANAANQIRFDDVRIMTVDAYEANFAARNAAKDVVIAINSLPEGATTLTEGVDEIKAAYAALTDDQKAMVSNYSVIENLPVEVLPLDDQVHALDKISKVVIPGGNVATGGTQGKKYTANYVEGTKSNFSNWGTVDVGRGLELRMGFTELSGFDLSQYDYMVFDLYVHGFTHKWVAGQNDCNLGFGTSGAWNNVNIGYVGNANLGPILNNLQEGWNHIVVPIDFTGTAKVVQFYTTAATATVTDPYALFDDFRLINSLALEADAERAVAKQVIAKIATVDASNADSVAAATAAYNELTDAQKAYVTNYSIIEEINNAPTDAQVVIDAIDGLKGSTAMFNDCDNNTWGDLEIVANYNSGALDKEVTADGYAKYILKNDGAPDFPMTFRCPEGVVPADYDEIVFDIYLSEGMEIVTGSWGNTHYQTANGGIDDYKVDYIALASYFEQLIPGQWNTVRMPASATTETIYQITLRPYGIFSGAAGDYVLVDNIRFEATDEITYADKDAINAVKEQYDTLSAPAKALVTNVETLNGYVQFLADEEAAAADVVNAINALPPVASEDPEADVIDLDDEAAVNAAEEALAALAADTKAALVPAEVEAILTAARARIDELKAASSDSELAAPVVSAIDALPAADAVRTSDEAAINSAATLYNNLGESTKAYMAENFADQVAKLDAVKAALAEEKGFEADAQAIVDAIAALPATVKAADEEVVNAAKAAFDAASADVQYYVTNKAVLDAALASVAQDKADIEAAKAVSDGIAALPETVTEDDVAAVQALYAQYKELNENAKSKLTEDEVNAIEAAYTASRMFGAVDVQFRAFDKFGADTNTDSAKPSSDKADKENRLEGKSSRSMVWENATSGDIRIFVYHYNQGQATGGSQWATDSFEGEGCWLVPCPDIRNGNMKMVFDLYVSDADVIKNSTGPWGLGFDTTSPNQWGNGGNVASEKVMAAFAAANNGEGLKDGWNQIVIPLSFKSNVAGQIIKVYDFTLAFCGATIPAGFTIKMDDVRFMNQLAVDTILPERQAAKDVTKAIYALADEYTYEDGAAIVAAYDKVSADYKDLVIGYDAFAAAFAEKFADEIAAEKAAAAAVVEQINGLTANEFMFNDCETLTKDGLEVVANLNSGGDIKELAEGQGVDGGNAAKFIKRADGTTEFNEAFRVPAAVSMVGYSTVEFDLYLSDGITSPVQWSPVNFQSTHANDPDTGKVGSYDTQEIKGDWKAGQWNHIVVPASAVKNQFKGEIAQIIVRIYMDGAAGEYILIDNLKFVGTKDITLEDKADVEAARAAYDALTDTQKAYVENIADLEAAEAAIAALEQAEADKAAAAAVDALIEAFPETVTPADADAVNAAKAAYDALTEDQKALVKAENVAALEAALEAIVAPQYTLGDIDGDGEISAADALEALKSVVNKVVLTDTQKLAADVNKDGEVNAEDALEILKEVVGKPNCF